MAKRLTLNLSLKTEVTLDRLEMILKTWNWRRNTIIQAAILAFDSLDRDKQKEFLRIIKQSDRRLR